ncbi:hypothetical protein GDO78_008690 [Eleutherodactylus coqui]|uniref:Acyl-CoA thioesterase 9 n=1 Tax=Eleutherodactylus coqui TaxID=57060 RepID=A0A8J6KBK9_ELECQ|nr:hypothetical protein GDO78_008690 [Eleutherodactylus coqui]
MGSSKGNSTELLRDKLREIVGASTNWRDHVQAMEERKALQSLLAKKQEDLPPRRMKDSYIEVLLPLGSEPQLREKYLNVYNNTISPDCDIKLTGHVSWVGKTSMEVKMHMLQLHDGIYVPVLDATFVMVARDPENRRPAFVNPLVPEGPEEESLFKQGELNKLRRVEFSTASLLKMAPTAEERKIIHDIFLNTLDTNTVSFRSRILPPNSVWMEDAKLKGLEICHPQLFDRNLNGFFPGGSRPYVIAVDDIMFQRPVEIGSLLFLSSQVGLFSSLCYMG